MHGFAADYDAVTPIEAVLKAIEAMPPELRPQFIEITLGRKIRLVWVFDRPVLIVDSSHAAFIIAEFVEKLNIPTLLAGYDANSEKPAERWSNGGEWYTVNEAPMSWNVVFGILTKAAKNVSKDIRQEIPLAVIDAEIRARFGGRWQGEFKLDAQGVRFWDPAADNPTGAQVKPDGMLCFTGGQPFVGWDQIFGKAWCDEQRVVSLGKAAEGLMFDGRTYWRKTGDIWLPLSRPDVCLALRNRGLSEKVAKGETASDVDKVLETIQVQNRVAGAAPLINYAPGVIELDGRKLLNTSTLKLLPGVAGTGDPTVDFPWIWDFLNGFFAKPELKPKEHFLAHLQRARWSLERQTPMMGQAVFICGPARNGKTLLIMRIVAPILGYRTANPYSYLTGETDFSDDIFESFVLAMNDEEGTKSPTARATLAARLKAWTVNVQHSYHPKFMSKVSIPWTGRIYCSLNEDPASTAILPEVHANTHDKLMFFASQPYKGVFPENHILEKDIIAEQLPRFVYWLSNIFKAPPEVLANTRVGVKSYFDEDILKSSRQQTSAHNLVEVLRIWVETHAIWQDDGGSREAWIGSGGALIGELESCATIGKRLMADWGQNRVKDALTALSRVKESGVEILPNGEFRIIRDLIAHTTES